MLRDDQNPKDTNSDLSLAVKDRLPILAYTKTNKLITALYIVTDILDKNEPLKSKLRDLGTGVVSDVNTNSIQAIKKISEIVSFLDIASAVKMISEMNCNILKKEFIELNKSIKEYTKHGDTSWLEEFVSHPVPTDFSQEQETKTYLTKTYQGQNLSVHTGTRIGVQKGSTLMKALSDKVPSLSNTPHVRLNHSTGEDFNVLKKHRRDEIIKIISGNKQALSMGGLTISDIRNGAKALSAGGASSTLTSCSEKTLQRELVSMVHENVLKKTGEKRWSKYFI
jgi:hypothetical protein